MIPKCIQCKRNPAIKDSQFGMLPCKSCQESNNAIHPHEIVPQYIKDQRKHPDVIQPFRNGKLSKEYVDTYGTKHIKATPEEIKKAKNVWDGFYRN